MQRRDLLKLLATVAVSGCSHQGLTSKPLRVVVAGAGIVGASIAYHLAKAGVAVTVIDKQGPASHASQGTFAWINASWAKQPRHYHALTQDSVAAWHELQQRLAIPVKWGGSIEWFNGSQRQKKLAQQIAEQVAWGEPARMVGAKEIVELEPNLIFAAETAAFSPNDGAVDPVLATQVLLRAAQQLGAVVSYPCELLNVSTVEGRLNFVATSTGSIAADKLVLATGAAQNISKRIAGVDIPQRTTPGAIVVTKPLPPLINRVISAPGVHLHQRNDGRFVIGEQNGAPKNEAHAMRLQGRPNEFPSRAIAQEHAGRILSIAKSIVPEIAEAELEDAYIGWRPLPIDGHPVLGSSPVKQDVYIAIMHSGVSLAPIVGQLVAQELTLNVELEKLGPYRPGRKFKNLTRY